MSRSASFKLQLVFLHLIAGGLALAYAWLVSGTHYVTSGVQFISPLAVVLLLHLAWLATRRELRTGFAMVAFGRVLATAICIVLFTVLCAMYAPLPAVAQNPAGRSNSAIEIAVYFSGCLVVLTLVILAAASAIYVIGYVITRGLKSIYHMMKGPPSGPDESRLFDASVVAMALLAISSASLEGLGPAFTFSTRDSASATVVVAASPARVWQEVGKATSPSFPLPRMLRTIPQPLIVLVDEGANLGARRIVHFKGREGEGDLVLEVIRRTDAEAVFAAVSDSSPIAMWVRHRSLTFRVEPAGAASRLTVASDYDRLLSPAWFFRPYIRMAAYLAVDVLARDTKQRAEAYLVSALADAHLYGPCLDGIRGSLPALLAPSGGCVSDLGSIKFGVGEIAAQTNDHKTAAAWLELMAGGLTCPRPAKSDEDIHSIAMGPLLDSINQNDNNTC
jgi:Polyketide cyclase / dehydrase and lipid transport